MSDDSFDSFQRSVDAYQRAIERLYAPRHARLKPETSMEPLTLDEWNPTQDAKPALTAFSGRKGMRFVEEASVYDAEGILLGYITLSHALLMPKVGVPSWLTPTFVRIEPIAGRASR